MDWLIVPRLARRAQARRSPQRRSGNTSFSSVTSGDDQFPSVERRPRPCLSAGWLPHRKGAIAAIAEKERERSMGAPAPGVPAPRPLARQASRTASPMQPPRIVRLWSHLELITEERSLHLVA